MDSEKGCTQGAENGSLRAEWRPKSRIRRPNSRFPRSAVRILENWLKEHTHSPYLTPDDQDELKAETGLKRSQISNWFANARKRRKVQPQPSPSTPEIRSTPLLVFSHIANLHPFERWLNLGLEHEAAAMPAIADALQNAGNTFDDRIKSEIDVLIDRNGHIRNWQYFSKDGSCVSSMEIRSYAANAKSVCSDEWRCSDTPSGSLANSTRRRRRPTQGASKDISKRFQCTFCVDRFKTKYDWQRHEKSHLPLEKWTCSPRGSVNVNPTTNEITCAFCGTSDPDPEHIKSHKYTTCSNRTASERMFFRKDHLCQHLRLMHNKCLFIASMNSWKSVTNLIKSRCGLCGALFTKWDERVDHLAEHFCDGALLEDWKGDWGFDAEVLKVLEHASLPGRDQHNNLNQGAEDVFVDCDDGLLDSWFGTEHELSTDYQTAEFNNFGESTMWESTTGSQYPQADVFPNEYLPQYECMSQDIGEGSINDVSFQNHISAASGVTAGYGIHTHHTQEKDPTFGGDYLDHFLRSTESVEPEIGQEIFMLPELCDQYDFEF